MVSRLRQGSARGCMGSIGVLAHGGDWGGRHIRIGAEEAARSHVPDGDGAAGRCADGATLLIVQASGDRVWTRELRLGLRWALETREAARGG